VNHNLRAVLVQVVAQSPAENCTSTRACGTAVALFHATTAAFRNVTGRPEPVHPLVSRFCDE